MIRTKDYDESEGGGRVGQLDMPTTCI
jgi:hypothetical protein